MSQRVTRASARLSTDPTSNTETPLSTSTEPAPPHQPARTSASRKRKASDEAPANAPRDTRKSKKARGEAEEPHTPDQAREAWKRGSKGTAAAMSSGGYVKDGGQEETQTDSGRPSSGTSGETSPNQAPRESSKRKSSRKKSSKEGALGTMSHGFNIANGGSEPSSGPSASSSKKEKKKSRRDQDVPMKDVDEKGDESKANQAGEEDEERGDTGGGADDPYDPPSRRFAEEELDAMERDDPFMSGYLGRFGGGPGGLSSSLRALSGILSSTHGRLRNILEQLRTKEDPSVQLIALTELSELLLVSNEDNLAGHFAPDQYVKELVVLMQVNEITGEENPEMMLLACRCIANMMEALPASTTSVVYGGAVPVLCQKLLEINFIDLAEQALITLEKISIEFPSSIVREGGLTACLSYIDFFATSTQRTAMTTAANCCRNIPDDSFSTVRDVMPKLLETLSFSDQKVVEQASLCVSRIVDSFKYNETKLEEIVSTDLLKAILRLLLPGSTNLIGPSILTQFLRVLSITARASPRLSVELLKMNVVDTLYQILTGVSAPAGTDDAALQIDKNVIMQAIIRTPREQIFETLNVICELLPTVPREGLSFLDDLYDAGYAVADRVSMASRSKKLPNDNRVEKLKECPKEVKRFAVILFPTLMYAYTSTVNMSVRQKVLTAQLKMLSNLDTDILEEALQGVTYASHLAAILTQQENHTLVTFALQAAELLLKRLESIYRPQFYREGVMSEIVKLAERPMKPEPPAVEKSDANVVPAAEVEVLEQHDEEMPEDEPETIEVELEHSHEDDEDEDEDADQEFAHHDRDDDEDEDGDGRHDEDEESEPPSPTRVHHITDMQDIVTLHAQRFVEVHGSGDHSDMRDKAARVLDDLESLAAELRQCYHSDDMTEGTALFRRLAKYFDGNALESITSYELMSSGIVDALLEVFDSSDEQCATKARSDFLEVFMATVNTSNLATGDSRSPSTAFSVLILKLQDLLSRSEHFEVITASQNAFESSSRSAASVLAKQLRLKLVADEDSGIPRAYRNIMVAIHAIATFKALDDYLRPRISLSERPRGMRPRDMPGSLAEFAASRAERPKPAPATAGMSDLPPFGSSLPTRSASKKSSRSKSSKSESAIQGESSKSEDSKSLRRSSRRRSAQASAAAPDQEQPVDPAEPPAPSYESQETVECADETHLTDDDEDDDVEAELDALVDDLEDGALDRDVPDPSAVNIETGNSGKVTARTEDGLRVGTPTGNTPISTPTARDRMSAATARLLAAREMLSNAGSASRAMSYASALQVPQDWHIEFSVNDKPISSDSTIYRACHYNNAQGEEFAGRSMWHSTHTIKFKRVPGPPPPDRGSTSPTSEQPETESGLPPSLDKHPITSNILQLMSILHDLNNNLDDVLAEHKTAVSLNAEPLSQFVNTKLTAKLNRQLEEPLIVASQCLPNWSEDLARLYPFLFPFETRHLFLQSTSFGYARTMTRWQGGPSENESRRHRDDRAFLGKVQRQKVRISRNRILESAMKVMELYGQSPSILEVEYFEEVGTGLGPTLEFYSTVSKEFSRKKTKMWRENESDGSKDYAFGRRGLFPAPMSEDTAASESGQKILHLFKMLGKFVARSMMDSRIIDVSFNPTFFRISDASAAVPPSLGAVAAVDQDLARSLKVLKKYLNAKQRIEDDTRFSPMQKAAKIDQIRINDAKIEDLGLDFTLPGYPDIELLPGGEQIDLTLDNAGEYIKCVIDLTLGSGVQRQIDSFRAGFTQVFPYTALKAFTPDELVMLFGRTVEDWSLETLMDSIKADHGFNLDSKSVRNLLQTMSEFEEKKRRDFLQFVTGSPKLPIGGKSSPLPSFLAIASLIIWQVSKLLRPCSRSCASRANHLSLRMIICQAS